MLENGYFIIILKGGLTMQYKYILEMVVPVTHGYI